MNTELKKFQRNKLWYAICSSSLAMTWLLTASVVQASDLQIYAKPESGQTTVILMLDNSGSMDRTYTGEGSQTRLARLKSGVNDLLTRDTVTLNDGTVVDLTKAYVGLGVFADSSSRYDGQIKVAAAPLGLASTRTTSGSQRNKLQAAVNAMDGSSWTPSANAMAEAAAYLLGTTTYWEKEVTESRVIAVDFKQLVRKYNVTSQSCGRNCTEYVYTYTYTLATCNRLNTTNFNTDTQTCAVWNTAVSQPNGTSIGTRNDRPNWDNQPIGNAGDASRPNANTSQTINYTTNQNQDYTYITNANANRTNSGTPAAKNNSTTNDILSDRTASNVNLRYKSPLPTNSVTCDGQGIYFLSDGLPNQTTTASVEPLIQTLLNDSTFTCPPSDDDTPSTSSDLPNPNGDGGNLKSNWNCMGALAKRLFSSDNPKARSINTAFVGFGSAFADMTANTDAARGAKYACKLGSKKVGDVCSPDATNMTLKNPADGFGNGGFYYVTTDAEVTQSIAKFIKDNQNTSVAPLTTGAISVPYDALNPNNLQENGYLRALAPSPGSNKITWNGNLKKYKVALTGTNAGAFQGESGGLVFDTTGKFRTGTKDYWNSDSVYNNTSYADGGKIDLGGAYSKVPMPILGQTQQTDSTGLITQYTYAAANQVRNLFTDVSGVTGTGTTAALDKMTVSTTSANNGGDSLLKIPESSTTEPSSATALATYVLGKFASNGQTTLKDFPIAVKLKLINFLGYSTDTNATTLPTTLTTPNSPYLSMGGSIHSLPVQLTYSGTLDASGNLTNARDQSILYGSMEGALHIVDASTGKEQMVFVPADILSNATASKALVVGSAASSTESSPQHGLDGAWVADPTYSIASTTLSGTTTTKVSARQMNIYGGMRMGGGSYYGLNVLNPSSPKLLFRIDSTTSGFNRLGQTWSKPVLANVRYNGVITRVMIVGGGYDQCYENPNFALAASVSNTEYPDTTCDNKTQAQGNAVYMINAKTGALIWSATYDSTAAATDGKKYMKHSIVSRISTLDRDADGLVDHLYFGDLGGQVFRADFNNLTGTSAAGFGKRVVRLADLATGNDTTSIAYTGANAPRFYEPPTVTIHDQGANTFIVLGVASGDRSTPLDVAPTIGRDGMKPATALSTRPVNNVYGVIDRDFIRADLITGTPTMVSINKVRADFKKNPQVLGAGETVVGFFFPSTGVGAAGWYRSLSSTSAGDEKAVAAASKTTMTRTRGGLKAFEEPMAITNNLVVPVYDPEGTGVSANAPCTPRVVGETDRQMYCLPYGVCLNINGTINTSREDQSGFKINATTGGNENIIGPGIRNITFVPKQDNSGTINSCGKLTMAGNSQGTGEWQCTSRLIQTRWYERYR